MVEEHKFGRKLQVLAINPEIFVTVCRHLKLLSNLVLKYFNGTFMKTVEPVCIFRSILVLKAVFEVHFPVIRVVA